MGASLKGKTEEAISASEFFASRVEAALEEVLSNVDRLLGLKMGVCEDGALSEIHGGILRIQLSLPSTRDLLRQSPPAQVLRDEFPLPDRTVRA